MQRNSRCLACHGCIGQFACRSRIFAGCWTSFLISITLTLLLCHFTGFGGQRKALRVQHETDRLYTPLPVGEVRQPVAKVDVGDWRLRRLIDVLLQDPVSNQSSSVRLALASNGTALSDEIDVDAHVENTEENDVNESRSTLAAAHLLSAPLVGFPPPIAMAPDYVLPGASSADTVDPLGNLYLAPGPGSAKQPETGNERAYRVAECTGDILAMSLYAVGGGLQVGGAVQDCTPQANPVTFDPELCARDIFAVVRVVNTIVAYGAQSSKACGKRKAECTRKIADIIRHIATVAESTALLAQRCGNSPDERFACGSTLERLSWQLGPFGGDITGIIRVCESPPDYSSPDRDYGQCAGYLVGAVGYVAAGGLQLSGTEDVCDVRNGGDAARCANRIFSALRAFTIAGNKATRGAGKCGGGDTMCGRDLTLMSAALLGVGQAASNAASRCEPGNITLEEGARCAESVSAMTKEIFVVSAKALDGANSCKGTDAANVACSSNIVKFLAALSFISEQLARVTYQCTPPFTLENSLYECSRDIQRIGSGADVVARGIGGTVADCNLGGKDRASKVIRLPRRFFSG